MYSFFVQEKALGKAREKALEKITAGKMLP